MRSFLVRCVRTLQWPGRALLLLALCLASSQAMAGATFNASSCATAGCHLGGPQPVNFNVVVDTANPTSLSVITWAKGLMGASDANLSAILADIAASLNLSASTNVAVPYGTATAIAVPYIHRNSGYFGVADTDGCSGAGCTKISTASGPSHGTVSYAGSIANGYVATYTPAPGYTGPDSWTINVAHVAPATLTRTISVIVAGATSTALSSSVNPTQHGNATTFTATVSGASPSGTVTFKDNGVTIPGTAAVTLNGSFSASVSVSNLAVGAHSITAVYSGNASNAASTSSTLTQTVNQRSSSTALSSGTNPSTFGSATVLSATVTGSTPSGNVVFRDGATVLGTVALSNTNATTSVATLSVSSLAVGTHSTVTAQYVGDTNNTASTSSNLVQVVNPVASSTVLASSTNPSVFNSPTLLTATVTGSAPSGSVKFFEGATQIGSTVSLVNSNATTSSVGISVSSLSVGTHNAITAQYLGDSNNAASTSAPISQVVTVVPTSTTLTSVSNPTAFNSAATFNATVSGLSPTGTVTFFDNGVSLGTASLNGSFVASLSVSSLSVASHSITASYGGDGNNGASSSATVTQVVNSAASATSLSSSANPSSFGSAITLTASIAGPSPTGTVTFKDGATTIGTASVAGGAASLTLSSLSVGSHSLTAVYGGDVNNAASTSSTLSQVVNAVVSGTVLSSSLNPSAFGSSTTLSAAVSGSSPSGSVTFKDGGVTLGTVSLSGGVATLAVASLAVGSHSLTAEYSGDGNNAASSSSALTQAVNTAGSSTALASSVNPTLFGASTVLTATVSGVSPGGSVTFKDGASTLGSVSLVAGTASLSLANLAVGAHSLTAVYGGDSNNAGSTSAVVTQTVNAVTSSVLLTSSVNPSSFGGSTTLTATVSGSSPSGSVSFQDGALTLGSVTLSGGVATLQIASLAVGAHSLTAVYGGDSNNLGSNSAVLSQTVNPATASVTLSSSVNPSVVSTATLLSATVSGISPSGSVNFLDGATVLGSATLASGVASLSVSGLTVGAHSLTAVYGGDGNNAPGSSAALVQTVNPAGLPAITTPASGSSVAFALNVATSLQLQATNFASSYAVTPALPAGFSLNTATGLLTVQPSAPMASTAYTFTASNVLGTGAPSVVNFAVGAPAPAACSISTPLNTAQTIDLSACAYPGLAPTGFAVALAPAHGVATVAGSQLTYTPANNYFGSDSLMVVASFGTLKAQVGTVSVTITGRPDPTQNPTVTGLVANQTQTAIRFSQAQVANFGRHMEGLRRPGGPGGLRKSLGGLTPAGAQLLGGAAAASAAWVAPASPAGNTFGSSAMSGNLVTPQSMASSNPALGLSPATQLPTGTAATASLPLESGVALALNQLGVPQAPLIGLLYNLDQNRSLNLGALKAAFGSGAPGGEALPGTSIWAEGVVSFGTRDASGALSAAEFSSSGVSVGVDIPVSESFTWGLGLGLARDVAYIGTDGSLNQSQGYSLAAYGSYLLGQNAYVEGMLGLGTIDFDMRRWVEPAADFAVSNRKGHQLFGSIGTGLEYRKGGSMVSPYVRLDFSQDTLQAVTETGAGAFALHYYDQTNHSAQGVLGLRGEAIHSTAFGWAVPRARVEWRQDLRGGSDAVISYADQIGGPRYAIAPTGSQRSAMVLGLGSEFLFRDGWSLGLDYQLTHASSTESSYALRMRLSKELGAKGLRKLLQEDEEIVDDENEITVDSGVTWDDNISRGKVDSDIRADMVYTLNASRTLEWPLGRNTRLLLTGVATGERMQNFNGLSRYALGAEATLQYRGAATFDAPTWGLAAKLTGEDFQSSLRDGVRSSLSLSLLQPLTDRITLFGAMSYNQRSANSRVFSTEEGSMRLNLDYALAGGATLYGGAEYREGDIVASGRASLENITLARAQVLDDAYPGAPFFSYRFKGQTLIGTLGYNIGLGARDSLDFSWRYVLSTPDQRPAWATSPRSYVTNQISASYLMRF